MNIDESNIVELTDEEGNIVKFEHIDTVRYEEEDYALLLPLEPLDDVDEDEMGIVILHIIEGEEEDTYEGVEDEDLLDAIFEQYLESSEDEDELE